MKFEVGARSTMGGLGLVWLMLAEVSPGNLYVSCNAYDPVIGSYGAAAKLLFADSQGSSYCAPAVPSSDGSTCRRPRVWRTRGSQGTLCLGGGVGRFDEPGEIRIASHQGEASLQLERRQFPRPTGFTTVLAGQTWSFQGWYRDANPTLTSNFTDAVTGHFQ